MKWLALTIVIVSALAVRGHAQSHDVDPLIADAEALAKKGDFIGAAGKFKAAYAIDPRPALICNVGVAYYKAKQLARADLFLNRCLERGTVLDAKFVDSVRAVIKAVEASLKNGNFTPLDIVVDPPSATIVVQAFGDDEAVLGSRVIWVESGAQKLTARAEGYNDKLVEIDAKGHDPQPVRITLEHKPVVEPVGSGSGSVLVPAAGSGSGSGGTTGGTTGSGSATIVPPPPPHLTHRYTTPSKVPAIASTAITAVALAITIVAYSNAHDSADRSQFALSENAYKSDVSSVDHWNALMGASLTLTVIGAGVSGYLWSHAFQSERVDVQPTSNGVAFRFSAQW